ncbi:MAG: hypothetical protein ACYC6Y_23460, partial [Thermoguttaceae bacterium]
MATEVACRCGKRFKAAPHLAGKTLSCPGCGQPIAIPAPPLAPAMAPPKVVNCRCGQRFRAQAHLAGTHFPSTGTIPKHNTSSRSMNP